MLNSRYFPLLLSAIGFISVLIFAPVLKATAPICTGVLAQGQANYDLHVISFLPTENSSGDFFRGFMDGQSLDAEKIYQTGLYRAASIENSRILDGGAPYPAGLRREPRRVVGFRAYDDRGVPLALRSNNPLDSIGTDLILMGTQIAIENYRSSLFDIHVTKMLETAHFNDFMKERRISNVTVVMKVKGQSALEGYNNIVGNLRIVDISAKEGYPSDISEAESWLRIGKQEVTKLTKWREQGYRIFFMERFTVPPLKFVPGLEAIPEDQYRSIRNEIKKALYQEFAAQFLGKDGFPDEKVIFAFETVTPEGQKAAKDDFGATLFKPEDFEPPLENPNLLSANRADARVSIQRAIQKLSEVP